MPYPTKTSGATGTVTCASVLPDMTTRSSGIFRVTGEPAWGPLPCTVTVRGGCAVMPTSETRWKKVAPSPPGFIPSEASSVAMYSMAI